MPEERPEVGRVVEGQTAGQKKEPSPWSVKLNSPSIAVAGPAVGTVGLRTRIWLLVARAEVCDKCVASTRPCR